MVDDNQDAAQCLAMLLEAWGHQVRLAYDGPTGLEVADNWQPQVVLLDIGMPGMDGFQVAQQLRKQEKTPSCLVALTGYGQEEDRRRSQAAGFDRHLIKPVEPAALQEFLAQPEVQALAGGNEPTR